MREGAVVLVALAQADGTLKTRPAVALRQLPGFGGWLICGISTQLQQHVPGFDETLTSGDADFASSGLARVSLIRLGFLQAVPLHKIMGRIGLISADRHGRLPANLARHLTPQAK